MIITCAKCSTSFNLNESLVKKEGAKVVCSVCKHTFQALPSGKQGPVTKKSTPKTGKKMTNTKKSKDVSTFSGALVELDLGDEINSFIVDDDHAQEKNLTQTKPEKEQISEPNILTEEQIVSYDSISPDMNESIPGEAPAIAEEEEVFEIETDTFELDSPEITLDDEPFEIGDSSFTMDMDDSGMENKNDVFEIDSPALEPEHDDLLLEDDFGLEPQLTFDNESDELDIQDDSFGIEQDNNFLEEISEETLLEDTSDLSFDEPELTSLSMGDDDQDLTSLGDDEDDSFEDDLNLDFEDSFAEQENSEITEEEDITLLDEESLELIEIEEESIDDLDFSNIDSDHEESEVLSLDQAEDDEINILDDTNDFSEPESEEIEAQEFDAEAELASEEEYHDDDSTQTLQKPVPPELTQNHFGKKQTGGNVFAKLLKTVFLLVALTLLLGMLFGGIYGANKMMGYNLPYISDVKVPFLDKYLKPPAPKSKPVNVYPTQKSVKSKFATNSKSGDLLVITGDVINDSNILVSNIKIQGTLHTADRTKKIHKVVYCGNLADIEQLETTDIKNLDKILIQKAGMNDSNVNIKPNKSVSFMIIFADLPDDLQSFTVKVLSFDKNDKGKSK